jgi:hypothetical protein
MVDVGSSIIFFSLFVWCLMQREESLTICHSTLIGFNHRGMGRGFSWAFRSWSLGKRAGS